MFSANFLSSSYAAQVSHEDRRSDREDDGQHEDRSRRQTDFGPREGALQLGALRRGKHDGIHSLVRSAYSLSPVRGAEAAAAQITFVRFQNKQVSGKGSNGTGMGKQYMTFVRNNMDQIAKKITDDLWVLGAMEVN